MLQSIRIFVTISLLMSTLLAPAIGMALSNTTQDANAAFFYAGIAMMTPTI